MPTIAALNLNAPTAFGVPLWILIILLLLYKMAYPTAASVSAKGRKRTIVDDADAVAFVAMAAVVGGVWYLLTEDKVKKHFPTEYPLSWGFLFAGWLSVPWVISKLRANADPEQALGDVVWLFITSGVTLFIWKGLSDPSMEIFTPYWTDYPVLWAVVAALVVGVPRLVYRVFFLPE